MRRKYILTAAVITIAVGSSGVVNAEADGYVAAYQQLMARATDETARAIQQIKTLETKIKDLEDRIAKKLCGAVEEPKP